MPLGRPDDYSSSVGSNLTASEIGSDIQKQNAQRLASTQNVAPPPQQQAPKPVTVNVSQPVPQDLGRPGPGPVPTLPITPTDMWNRGFRIHSETGNWVTPEGRLTGHKVDPQFMLQQEPSTYQRHYPQTGGGHPVPTPQEKWAGGWRIHSETGNWVMPDGNLTTEKVDPQFVLQVEPSTYARHYGPLPPPGPSQPVPQDMAPQDIWNAGYRIHSETGNWISPQGHLTNSKVPAEFMLQVEPSTYERHYGAPPPPPFIPPPVEPPPPPFVPPGPDPNNPVIPPTPTLPPTDPTPVLPSNPPVDPQPPPTHQLPQNPLPQPGDAIGPGELPSSLSGPKFVPTETDRPPRTPIPAFAPIRVTTTSPESERSLAELQPQAPKQIIPSAEEVALSQATARQQTTVVDPSEEQALRDATVKVPDRILNSTEEPSVTGLTPVVPRNVLDPSRPATTTGLQQEVPDKVLDATGQETVTGLQRQVSDDIQAAIADTANSNDPLDKSLNAALIDTLNQGLDIDYDTVSKRLINAREQMIPYRSASKRRLMSDMARRGLVGSGIEAEALAELEANVQTSIIQAFRDIVNTEMDRSSNRFTNALGVAADLVPERTRLAQDRARLQLEERFGIEEFGQRGLDRRLAEGLELERLGLQERFGIEEFGQRDLDRRLTEGIELERLGLEERFGIEEFGQRGLDRLLSEGVQLEQLRAGERGDIRGLQEAARGRRSSEGVALRDIQSRERLGVLGLQEQARGRRTASGIDLARLGVEERLGIEGLRETARQRLSQTGLSVANLEIAARDIAIKAADVEGRLVLEDIRLSQEWQQFIFQSQLSLDELQLQVEQARAGNTQAIEQTIMGFLQMLQQGFVEGTG